MHGSVHPREVGAPQGPRVARDGVRKKKQKRRVISIKCPGVGLGPGLQGAGHGLQCKAESQEKLTHSFI